MASDPAARRYGQQLRAFVLSILLVRGVPVLLTHRLERDPPGGLVHSRARDSLRIGLYAATGLPIIVAVTSVAVSSGQMTDQQASLLVAGGAITVLVLPITATLLGRGEVRPTTPDEIDNRSKTGRADDHGYT